WLSLAPRCAERAAACTSPRRRSSVSRMSSSSRLPRMTANRLLKSCASPEASWPTASSFCDWTSAASARSRSAASAISRPLAPAKPRQDRILFGEPVRRKQNSDRAADHFVRRVAENDLGTPVPARDDAVQILADDRVVRGLDNGRQVGAGIFPDRALADVH